MSIDLDDVTRQVDLEVADFAKFGVVPKDE
jgi:hypothetical protein